MLLKKALNRIIKNISQIPFFSNLAEVAYHERLKQYRSIIDKSFNVDLNLVDDINQYGVSITSLSELQIPHTDKMLSCLTKVLPELIAAAPNSKKQFYICTSRKNLSEFDDIYLWGLESKLLDLVEKCLCLPAAYHGIYLRKDLVNNVVRKSRLWHLDKEDRRSLKVIIYLNDVNQDNGAFQYIPKHQSKYACQQLKYNHEYLHEDKIGKVISPSEWISCEGKAGTVLLVDTANVFHRGQIPKTSDRLALFFDYTSSHPLRPYYCKSSFPVAELLKLSHRLTLRQKSCVFWNPQLKQQLDTFQANFK